VKTLLEAVLALALVAGWAIVARTADGHMARAQSARTGPAPAAAASGDPAQTHLAALLGHRLGEQLDERIDRVDVGRRRAGEASELDH
jgi:hypothetical protein